MVTEFHQWQRVAWRTEKQVTLVGWDRIQIQDARHCDLLPIQCAKVFAHWIGSRILKNPDETETRPGQAGRVLVRIVQVNAYGNMCVWSGAPGEARTLNHWIRSPLLYPLSYGGRAKIILEFGYLLQSRTHVIISPRATRRRIYYEENES